MQLLKHSERIGENARQHSWNIADGQRSEHTSFSKWVHRVVHNDGLTQHFARVHERSITRIRQFQPVAQPFEKQHAQFLF